MQAKRRPLPVRVVLVLFGGILVLVGLVGLFVPVMPGWIFIVPGLAILAGEFVWAQTLLERAREQLDRARSLARGDDEREAA